jgi:hypothetical protein
MAHPSYLLRETKAASSDLPHYLSPRARDSVVVSTQAMRAQRVDWVGGRPREAAATCHSSEAAVAAVPAQEAIPATDGVHHCLPVGGCPSCDVGAEIGRDAAALPVEVAGASSRIVPV